MARKKKQVETMESLDSSAAYDAASIMSHCVALCQEERWREALHYSKTNREQAMEAGHTDVAESLRMAEAKIEYSFRRQLATSLISSAHTLLAKEYLLDVGE